MEPVISPMVIYWITVLGTIQGTVLSTIIMSGIALFFSIIGAFITKDEGDYGNFNIMTRSIKISSIILAISIVLNIFLPTRNELIVIMSANYVTKDVVESVGDGVDKYLDKVITILSDEDEE